MKKIIKKILREDRRQMFLDKIVHVMKNEHPLFKNMEIYGFYDQLSEDEINYIYSEIFGKPVMEKGMGIEDEDGKNVYTEYIDGFWYKTEYDDNGNETYYENSDGGWVKWEYDENGNEIYYENSRGEIRDNR